MDLHLFLPYLITVEDCSGNVLLSFGMKSLVGLRRPLEDLLGDHRDAVCFQLLLDLFFLASHHLLTRFGVLRSLARPNFLAGLLQRSSFCESVLIKLLADQFSASVEEVLILVLQSSELSVFLSAVDVESDGFDNLLAQDLISLVLSCMLVRCTWNHHPCQV